MQWFEKKLCLLDRIKNIFIFKLQYSVQYIKQKPCLRENMSFQMTKLISYNKNLWNWRKSFARHFTKIINNKNENTMSHISGRGMWEINDIIFVAFSFYFPLVQLANGKYAFLKTLHKLIDCFGTVHYDLINCYFLFNLEYFFVITLLYFPLIFLSEKCVRFLEA